MICCTHSVKQSALCIRTYITVVIEVVVCIILLTAEHQMDKREILDQMEYLEGCFYT